MSLPTFSVPMPTGVRPMAMDAAGLASGQAFLVGELEKRNPELNEPLTSVTWARDIVAETGGGYVTSTSNYFVDYGTAGANEYGLIGGDTNNLPVIQGNITKDVYPVNPLGYIVKVPFMDEQRMMQVGRSLSQILEDGLRLNYQKALDANVYTGFTSIGATGLVNDASVTQSFAALNGGATSRLWSAKTADEILADVNTALNAGWAASEYDVQGMPNHILLPPANFAYIVSQKVSSAGNISILQYLLENNIAKAQGVDLQIVPCRQVIGQGSPVTTGGANSNRMVVYRNDKKIVSFDITVPLTRVMTAPDPNQVAYISPYISYVSTTKIKYFQPFQYVDGI